MKASRLALIVAASLAALPALPAAAQGQNPLATREAQLPNVLSWLQTQGVKLTFLGEEGGLRGYLGESANGKMQTFYVTPDGNHVVAGILFRSGGTNVTGVQIGEMRARFESAAKDIVSATVENGPKPEAPGGAPVDAAGPATPEKPVKPESPKESEAPAQKPDAQPQANGKAGIVVPPPSGPVPGAEGKASDVWISKLDRAEFFKAVEAAPFFEVGAVSAKPVLWMVADPQCPYCHKTWDHIRSLVYAKKLRVRIILIAGLKGSEPKARELLSQPVPARMWLDTNAGRTLGEPKTDQNSEQWRKAGEFLDRNMQVAQQFGIDRTPFLAYVGTDGNFYSSVGLPNDLDGFLASSGAR